MSYTLENSERAQVETTEQRQECGQTQYFGSVHRHVKDVAIFPTRDPRFLSQDSQPCASQTNSAL